MNKEEEKNYVFAQLSSLPNAFQYVSVTNYIENLEQENKELKEHIEKYEHYCKTTGIEELMKENKQLKDNWNKLKEYFKFEIEFDKRWYIPETEEYTMQKHFPDDTLDGFSYALEKMQELEKGEIK